jgi:hypothetical protein
MGCNGTAFRANPRRLSGALADTNLGLAASSRTSSQKMPPHVFDGTLPHPAVGLLRAATPFKKNAEGTAPPGNRFAFKDWRQTLN